MDGGSKISLIWVAQNLVRTASGPKPLYNDLCIFLMVELNCESDTFRNSDPEVKPTARF